MARKPKWLRATGSRRQRGLKFDEHGVYVGESPRRTQRTRRPWRRRKIVDDDERYAARYGYGGNAPWFLKSFAAGGAVLLVFGLIVAAIRLALWLFRLAIHP